MYRISSNWTIFFKLFIPTVWITFFGLFTLGILLSEPANIPFGGSPLFKMGFALFFLIFLAILYFTLMRLKRIDMAKDGVYVSNYFKTYRYQYEDIESIKENNWLLFTQGTLQLKQKGKFGQKITFIISHVHFNDFIKIHPELLAHLIEEKSK